MSAGGAAAGKSRLHVVFRGASGYCPQPAHRTWTGPSVLTPRYPRLLMVRAAGDFEGYLSFGLAARGGYHISSLAGPDRVVIDFTTSRLLTLPPCLLAALPAQLRAVVK